MSVLCSVRKVGSRDILTVFNNDDLQNGPRTPVTSTHPRKLPIGYGGMTELVDCWKREVESGNLVSSSKCVTIDGERCFVIKVMNSLPFLHGIFCVSAICFPFIPLRQFGEVLMKILKSDAFFTGTLTLTLELENK